MNDHTETARKVKGLSIRLLVAAAVFLASLLVFAAIADEMVLENENHFDEVVFSWIEPMVNTTMTSVSKGMTFFGSSLFLFPAYVLLIFFCSGKAAVIFAGDCSHQHCGYHSAVLFKIHFSPPPDDKPNGTNNQQLWLPKLSCVQPLCFFGLLIYIL